MKLTHKIRRSRMGTEAKINGYVLFERRRFGKTAEQESLLRCTGICPVRGIKQGRKGRSAECRRERCKIKQGAKHDMRARMTVFDTEQNAAT